MFGEAVRGKSGGGGGGGGDVGGFEQLRGSVEEDVEIITGVLNA